jgi:Ca-activated chloride channel family protein
MKEAFFEFHDAFFLVLGFCFLFFLFLWSHFQKRKASLKYPVLSAFESIGPSFKQRFVSLPWLLRLLALSLLIFALARPQSGFKSTEVNSEGVDIILAIDTSGSMKALDFTLDEREANRLDVIKKVITDFISKRQSDRMGMVVFGEYAFTQCPMTTDYDTLRAFIKMIQIGVAGDGTAIGNGLATAVKRLKSSKAQSKVIILLTDGVNNAGDISPLTAANMAKELGIKVYTIGVGSKGRVLFPQETPFGIQKVPMEVDLDEDTLKEIAQISSGHYFRATDTQGLEDIYATIDQLEKSEVKMKQYREANERFQKLVYWALIFMGLEIFFAHTWLRRIP